MKMVRHQTQTVTLHPKRFVAFPKEIQKRDPVIIREENRPTLIAAGRDVVQSTWKLDAKWSCHSSPRFPRIAENRAGIFIA
jgi:hypothetical protein